MNGVGIVGFIVLVVCRVGVVVGKSGVIREDFLGRGIVFLGFGDSIRRRGFEVIVGLGFVGVLGFNGRVKL